MDLYVQISQTKLWFSRISFVIQNEVAKKFHKLVLPQATIQYDKNGYTRA